MKSGFPGTKNGSEYNPKGAEPERWSSGQGGIAGDPGVQAAMDTLLQIRYGKAPAAAPWERLAAALNRDRLRIRLWRRGVVATAAAAALVWMSLRAREDGMPCDPSKNLAIRTESRALLRPPASGAYSAFAPDGTSLPHSGSAIGLEEGGRIVVHEDARGAALELDSDIEALLGGGSDVSVRRLRARADGGHLLELRSGEIIVDIPRIGTPFHILATECDISVLGTRFGALVITEKENLPFSLRALPLPAVIVAVERGAVRMAVKAQTQTLGPGELALATGGNELRALGNMNDFRSQIEKTWKEGNQKEATEEKSYIDQDHANAITHERSEAMKLKQGTMMAALVAAMMANSTAMGGGGKQAEPAAVQEKVSATGVVQSVEGAKLVLNQMKFVPDGTQGVDQSGRSVPRMKKVYEKHAYSLSEQVAVTRMVRTLKESKVVESSIREIKVGNTVTVQLAAMPDGKASSLVTRVHIHASRE